MIRNAIAFLAILVSIATASEYSVRAWQSEDGLPGNVVRSVIQSSDGFIWVASAEGIARFDGIEFETLEIPPGITLPRIGPNRLFATPGGIVWFSGHRGSLLRIQNHAITRILDDEKLTTPWHVSQIVPLPSGDIIARRGTETWLVSSDPPQLLDQPGTEIESALRDDIAYRADQGRILPDGTVNRLVDHSGRIWKANASPGIQVTDPGGTPFQLDISDIDRSITLSEFLEDSDHNVWVATPVSGLLKFRKLRAQVVDQPEDLSDRSVIAILPDIDGSIWVADRSSGVDHITGDTMRHFEFSPETAGPRRPASVLYQDRDGVLWAASRDGLVFRWNGQRFDPAFPKDSKITKIDTIYQDSGGTHWFGGTRGLFRVHGETIRRLGPRDGVPNTHITLITGGPSGRPWFGTMDGRVFKEQDGEIIRVSDDKHNRLGERKIIGLLVESDTHAWAATLGAGLHFWDGRQWHSIDHKQGLPDPRLTCILTDPSDHLWLGSLGGIFRVSRTELINRIARPDAPLHWLRINRSDGLPTRECIGSALPAGCRTRDGALYFPTSRGLVTIQPSQIETSTTPPPVLLREVRANGSLLKKANDVYQCGPGRTRLELSYHGLGLSAPEKTTYRTRLRGLDDSWHNAGNQREKTYESVPHGRYTFEVAAINGDGVKSKSPASATIIITPRFWETRWFLILSIATGIAAATGTGALVSRIRMKRRIHALKLKQSIETERARISRDLHDDLGASLTELSILSALAAETPDESTLRPALNQLSGKAKTVVGTLDEIVWAATPSEDSLRSLIEYISAFAREFLENANITLRTDVIRNIPDIPIGPNRRHNIFLATRESLNNAVKHSEASEIHLLIDIEEQHLIVRVIDNGRGFAIEYAGSGDGLSNLKKRMTDSGGTCTIESAQGEGTTATLTLPLPRPPQNGH